MRPTKKAKALGKTRMAPAMTPVETVSVPREWCRRRPDLNRGWRFCTNAENSMSSCAGVSIGSGAREKRHVETSDFTYQTKVFFLEDS